MRRVLPAREWFDCLWRFAVTAGLLLGLAATAAALEAPPLTGRVNDRAGMLSPAASARLEQQLAALERSDSTQVALLTVPSLDGDEIASFSLRVAEAWRLGQKGRDNGVLLVIARQEKKMRIEVGRGLEGRLTDLVAGRIIRNEIAPSFRAGRFDEGVERGVAAIIAACKGEYTATPKELRHGKRSGPPLLTLGLFLVVGCVLLGGISRWLAGTAGAIGLPLAAFLVFPGLGLTLLLGLLVLGFVVGLLLSLLSGGGFYGGGPWFGGGWYGGGFGGGSGGDGGFDGGGGDFGGGGASGDW